MKIWNIAITRIKTHKYLRITIEYSSLGKVKLSIVGYIGKNINYIPEDMNKELATPAARHPFNTAEDATKLSRTDADFLHNFVSRILYLSKLSRPDIRL